MMNNWSTCTYCVYTVRCCMKRGVHFFRSYRGVSSSVEMSLLRYFKPANGLPDPKGSLSTTISPDVIAEMNKEVEEATRSVAGGKRGHYQTYTSSERSQIGKYASQHGATAASRHFSHKLKKSVSRSTAKSMKKAYEEELRKRRRCDDESDQEISDRACTYVRVYTCI